MKYLKNLIIGLLISLSLLFSLTFIITFLNYKDLMNINTLSFCKFLVILISILCGSCYFGIKAKKRGFLEGIKFALIYIFIFVISSLLLDELINIKDVIFYIMILLCAVFGSTLGINMKKSGD